MKCADCKFFRTDSASSRIEKTPPKVSDIDYGYCHRWPPSVPLTQGDDLSEHVGVWLDDWCGEFEAKA